LLLVTGVGISFLTGFISSAVGAGHDVGGSSTRTQQGLPNTPRLRRAGNQADLTPNFRSAAAMAGWDDEALLIAAIGRGTPEGPSCTNSCEGCPQCRERKRGTRTPGQAATPLSAGRRYEEFHLYSSMAVY